MELAGVGAALHRSGEPVHRHRCDEHTTGGQPVSGRSDSGVSVPLGWSRQLRPGQRAIALSAHQSRRWFDQLQRGAGGQLLLGRLAQSRNRRPRLRGVGRWRRRLLPHELDEAVPMAPPPMNARRPDGTPYAPGDWQNRNGFYSPHIGGGHFTMADGGVRFLSENIDLGLYRALATIAGGEPVSAD
ncbi:MAG: hypothetical protein B7Z55_10110 [Planctomycetales bacterium 12-60-4]|nr:MAG: hypothetical protein B7Z55_10110 [Planctomycetales bacterium 12-60-4]